MTEPRLFIHRLALALGRTVEDLLSTLSPQELKGWLLYDRQAGLPDIAAQWQRAASISVAAAAAGSNVDPREYIPVLAWGDKRATAQDIRKAFTVG